MVCATRPPPPPVRRHVRHTRVVLVLVLLWSAVEAVLFKILSFNVLNVAGLKLLEGGGVVCVIGVVTMRVVGMVLLVVTTGGWTVGRC